MDRYRTVTATSEAIWEGVVRIDDTLDDYVSSVTDKPDAKELTVKDVKYHHINYYIPDYERYTQVRAYINPYAHQEYFPNEIILIVKDKDLRNYMKCTAAFFYYQQQKERRTGLFKKETYFQKVVCAKGFILEQTDHTGTDFPCMASYRANIGGDNAFEVQQQGIVSFYTSSSSALYCNNPARKSITCIFVASNQVPFVAYIRKKGTMSKVMCYNEGIKEESEDKGEEVRDTKKAKPKEDPLQVLKLRLAKGEITKLEYDELRKVLESS